MKFIKKSRFSKYLLYAIGEIVLVMIGILLALQISNLNENKKVQKRQTEYLQQIRAEMNMNHSSIDGEKRKLEGILEGLRNFVSLKSKKKETFDEKELSEVWASVFSKSCKLRYENGVLSALISTGNIKEILDDTIRQRLASWGAQIDRVSNQEEVFNRYLERGNDYLQDKGSFRQILDDKDLNKPFGIDTLAISSSNKFLLESRKFENIMAFAIATGETLRNDVYSEFQNQIDTLVLRIDDELVLN